MIYLDTCLVIYFVENRDGAGDRLRLEMRTSPDRQFVISPLVRMETLVRPLRDGDAMLQRRYEKAMASFALLALDASTYDQAALLRARFGLRTPDALHLACAQLHDCTAFWTNDRRLQGAARGLSVAIDG